MNIPNGQPGTFEEGHGQSQDNGMDGAMQSWGDGDAPQQQSDQQQQAPQGNQQPAQQSQDQSAQKPTTPVHGPDGKFVSSKDTQQAASGTSSATPPAAADPAALVRAAVEATAQAMQSRAPQQSTQQQTPPMSDEEFAKHYNLPRVDAKALERLFDKDPAQGAAFLNELLKQTYTAAFRMSNDMMQAQMQQRMQEFQPRLSQVDRFIAEQNEKAANDRFYKTFPTLANERDLVQEVLDATQAKIARKELSFADEKQAFQYVADATNRVLSRMAPSGGSPGRQPSAGQRQMASASSAGRSSGSSAKPVATEMDTMMGSWDQRPE